MEYNNNFNETAEGKKAETSKVSVPYIIHESMLARMERQIKSFGWL